MNLLFTDKPAGLTTHTSLNDHDRKRPLVDPHDGFVEMLSDRLGAELWPVHRLDRETSGAMIFARDSASANEARELFETRAVRKTYWLITNRSVEAEDLTIESHIDREGSSFVSRRDREPNARTHLRKLKSSGRHSLWEAKPETGRPHQIRLHAADAGIAILGDEKHGGDAFPTLGLTSRSIEIDGKIHETPAPIWFDQLELLRDSLLIAWLAAFDRRERWRHSLRLAGVEDSSTTYRWIHHEGDPLRLETLGSVAWLSWFRDTDPDESEWTAIRRLLKLKSLETWYLQVRGDRGRQPNRELVFMSDPEPPTTWMGEENGLRFEFRRDSGLSPGLFLDQRRNRAWLRREAKSKTLLNLFSYTSGFSVAAAAGGAAKTISVDLSRTFLEWSKRNFALNDLALEGHEFRSMDSREYLTWAKKKGLSFDLIVCDPPSFSRSDKSVFRLEKDFEALLHSCLYVLAPQGRLLFSCNFESWSDEEFESRVLAAVKSSGVKARLTPTPSPDPDFETPRQPRHMKSAIITRL